MKKLLFSISALFFLLAGCTSIGYSAYEKEDYKRIAEANNRAFTIHEQLARLDEGNNLFFHQQVFIWLSL